MCFCFLTVPPPCGSARGRNVLYLHCAENYVARLNTSCSCIAVMIFLSMKDIGGCNKIVVSVFRLACNCLMRNITFPSCSKLAAWPKGSKPRFIATTFE